MEVLSSRVLLNPTDLDRSLHFYGEVLGLAVAREFGVGDHRGRVYHIGSGLLEVSGRAKESKPPAIALWLQVRDARAETDRLRALGVTVESDAKLEPWGLVEGWIADPDGYRIVLVEIPEDHPIRRDHRSMGLPLPPRL